MNVLMTELSLSLSGSTMPTIKAIIPESLFRSIISSILHYRVAEDEETLTEIATMIYLSNPELSRFNPRLAVVTTWRIVNGNVSNNPFEFTRHQQM